MIIIALGSNIPGPWGNPAETLDRAVIEISETEIEVVARSTWMETKPYGVTDQPGFVNGAMQVKTQLAPVELLKILQEIEILAGRERREKWGPRTLDLDIIAYNKVIMTASDTGLALNLPHSDLHNRSFVLLPIQELNPSWQHPVSGRSVTQMLEDLAKKAENNSL